jgi:hypothetical protein
MLCINLRLGTASLAGCMPEELPRAVTALFSVERVREGVAELVGSVVNELIDEGTLRASSLYAYLACGAAQGEGRQYRTSRSR